MEAKAPFALVDYVSEMKRSAGARVEFSEYANGEFQGSYVKGETANAERSAFGYSEAHALDVWRILREAGFDLPGAAGKRKAELAKPSPATLDRVEGFLAQALSQIDDGAPWHSVTLFSNVRIFADPKARARAKRARRVERLREAGLCIVCGKNETEGATCAPCGSKANARTKARKAKTP